MKQNQPFFLPISIEYKMLLSAVSVVDNDTRASRVQDLTVKEMDWESILNNARHHGISALLCRQLGKLCLQKVPQRVSEEFKNDYKYTMGSNMIMAQALVRLIELFRQTSIPFLPYKGLILAHGLYEDIACRQMCDIDFLVKEIDVERSKKLLRENLYIPLKDISSPDIQKMLKQDCEEVYLSLKHQVKIEMHWRLLPPATSRAADVKDIWDHVLERRIFGVKTLLLEPEWNALIIFLHAGIKHRWSEIKLIADVARIIQKYANMDWNAIMRQAALRNEEVPVLLGVYLAHSLLDANFPRALLPWIKRFPQVRAFAGLVMGRLFRKDHGLPGFREWRGYIRALQNINLLDERKWFPLEEFCRYTIAVFTPEFKDKYKFVQLPKVLPFLQFFIRPVRLFAQHGIDLMNRIK